jgi:hypothetical protein
MNRMATALAALALGTGCDALFGIEEGLPNLTESSTAGGDDGASFAADQRAQDVVSGTDATRPPGIDASVNEAGGDIGPEVDAGDSAAMTDGSLFAEGGDGSQAGGCAFNELACDGGCVPADDPHHCGTCENDCANLPGVLSTGLGCSGRTCSYHCVSGSIDCFDAGTGCPTSLANLCNGQCSDSQNCGACGHDCAGGSCIAGQCQPFAMTTGQPFRNYLVCCAEPASLVVRDTGIFWADGISTLAGMPLDGGTVTTYATNQHEPDALAVDSTNIYWTNFGNPGDVHEAPVAGGPGPDIMLASSQYIPRGIAVDSTWVYWTGDVGAGTISKMLIDGGGSPIIFASAQNYPVPLGTDGTHLFWTIQGSPSAVVYAPLSGGAAANLATVGNMDLLTTMVVGPTGVFWVNGSASIQGTPLTGGIVNTYVSSETVDGIAADNSYIYYTNSRDVKKVSLSGGNPTAVATSQPGPWAIATYGNFIYWLNIGDGSVMRLVK